MQGSRGSEACVCALPRVVGAADDQGSGRGSGGDSRAQRQGSEAPKPALAPSHAPCGRADDQGSGLGRGDDQTQAVAEGGFIERLRVRDLAQVPEDLA